MSTRSPPNQTRSNQPRVAAKIGPIELHEWLDQPVVTVDRSQRTVTTDPTNEPSIIQSLGTNAPKIQIDGTGLIRHANAFDRLVLGGPFEVRTDRYTGFALARGVSTNPYKWRPAEGVWGYQYKLDLVGTPPPAQGKRASLPGNTAVAASSGHPEPRQFPTTEIGGVSLPAPLEYPFVAIDSAAEIKEHAPIGKPAVPRYGGKKASTLEIKGSAYLSHARQLADLTRSDQITIRSDRFQGDALVKSVRTEPTDAFYERNPNRPGWTYRIKCTEVLGNG